MSFSRTFRTRIGWALAIATVACNDVPPLVEPVVYGATDGTPGSPEIRLAVSDLDAAVGESVLVAVELDMPDSQAVHAIQGHIGFETSRLEYRGQVALDRTLTVVNGVSSAESGRLPVLSFRLDGLTGYAAIVSFEVVGTGYAAGLSYRSDLVASRDAGAVAATFAAVVAEAPRLATHGAPFADATPERLAALAGFDPPSEIDGPMAVHPKAVMIGDCNRDTSVDALDLVAIAFVAVGIDASPTDPNDLRLCDVDRSGGLDALDVLDVSRFAVGLGTLFGPVGHRFEAIAVSATHTCALNAAGAAYCWGSNTYGELGDGSNTESFSPVAVSGGHAFTSIQTGSTHTCGIAAAGPTYCWGRNNYGQLGDGSVADSSVPVQVVGGHPFVALTDMWFDHTCGLLATGEAWCWGNAQGGAVGNGLNSPPTPTSTPIQVTGGIVFTDISAAWHTTCAIDPTGQTYCWGFYGNTSTATRGNPETQATGLAFVHIEAGADHFCGIDGAAASWCWSNGTSENDYGEFGDGNSSNSQPWVPVQTTGGHAWSTITTGFDHTCALDTSGQPWCWGLDDEGQNGAGSISTSLCGNASTLPCRVVPTAVAGGHTFTTIDSSWDHTCAIDTAGVVWCWGSNRGGQLGVGSGPLDPYRLAPTSPVQGGTFTSIALGSSVACGIESTGQARCWGNNSFGQVGDGTQVMATTAQAVGGGIAFTQVAPGGFHSCGVEVGGAAHCWGYGSSGQLGDGTFGQSSSTPVSVSGGPSSFSSVDVGGNHTCGLDGAGQAYCWGFDFYGQLGDGTPATGDRATPDTVFTTLRFTEIEAGGEFSCALGQTSGYAWCWGRNAFGQLGDGTNTDQAVPVTASVAFTQIDVHPGGGHACGLNAAGEVWCWGSNSVGQLGDGTTTISNVPVQVASSLTFVSLRSGATHTCARDDQGEYWCWGDNGAGQLGDGTRVNRSTPVQVSGGSRFVDISLGGGFTCGIEATGATYCWGSNASGALGLGAAPVAVVPMQVAPF